MTAAPVMSITDELVAELEAAARESIYGCPTWLERDGYSLSCADASDVNHIVTAAPSVMLALLAERAELKRDAARYRWLREDARQDVDGYMSEVPVIVYANNYSDDWRNRIDAAIDAAMQAAQ